MLRRNVVPNLWSRFRINGLRSEASLLKRRRGVETQIQEVMRRWSFLVLGARRCNVATQQSTIFFTPPNDVTRAAWQRSCPGSFWVHFLSFLLLIWRRQRTTKPHVLELAHSSFASVTFLYCGRKSAMFIDASGPTAHCFQTEVHYEIHWQECNVF